MPWAPSPQRCNINPATGLLQLCLGSTCTGADTASMRQLILESNGLY